MSEHPHIVQGGCTDPGSIAGKPKLRVPEKAGAIPRKNTLKKAGAAVAGIAVICLVSIWFAVTQPVFARANSIRVAPVSQERLVEHVRFLTNAQFPRDWKHPENLDMIAAYIGAEFALAKGVVREQAYQMEGTTYRNVIAVFGPDTPERIVVGAHYDAHGEFPGADDNASGVAGLIELSHLLGKAPPPMRVELVAFTLEEPKTAAGLGLFRSPFGGSAVHAASLVQQNARVRAVVNLEMIGCFSDDEDSQAYPLGFLRLFYPSRGNFITVIGQLGQGFAVRKVKSAMRSASSLPVYSMSAPTSIVGIDWSDHTNYWDAGYTAVMVTDTSFYRNKAYHTEHDTLDRLDFTRMAMVVQGLYQAVIELAK